MKTLRTIELGRRPGGAGVPEVLGLSISCIVPATYSSCPLQGLSNRSSISDESTAFLYAVLLCPRAYWSAGSKRST